MPKLSRGKGKKYIWNMKGCHGRKRSMRGGNLAYDPNRTMSVNKADFPLAYTGQSGGCGSCMMRGGGGVPAPLVGNEWSSNPQSWPHGGGSQLGLNTYSGVQVDIPPGQERIGSVGASKQSGGKRRKTRRVKKTKRHKRSKRIRGGGVGLGGIFGGIGSDLGNAYNTLAGKSLPPSSSPWLDQYSSAGKDNLGYLNFSSASRVPAVQTR